MTEANFTLTINEAYIVFNRIRDSKVRSAWVRGKKFYALELAGNVIEALKYSDKSFDFFSLDTLMLNGARTYSDYSYGGCALIYDADICFTLCPPSEQRKKLFGVYRPNKRETWLDVQARALRQASWIVKNEFKNIHKEAI